MFVISQGKVVRVESNSVKVVWFCEPEEEVNRINYEIWVKDDLFLNCYLLASKEMPLEELPEALLYLESYAIGQLQATNSLPI
jgi:hypothetical protein